MWFFLKISLPHAARHRTRTALTIIGIAVGVACIIATQSVTSSTLDSFAELVTATAGEADLHVVNAGVGVHEGMVDRVRRVQGVAAVAPYVEAVVEREDRPADTLTLFGVDLFGERPWATQIPRTSVEVPDELGFVSGDDSVAISRRYSHDGALALGAKLDVVTALGPRTLVVRGFIDSPVLDALFDGRVAAMDLPAAQALFGKVGKLDRLDVHLLKGVALEKAKADITAVLQGSARVAERSAYGKSARDLLFSMRVVLALASVIAIVVAFFIIYHTVAVSVAQRRHDIVLLRTVGVPAATLVVALLMEAVVIATIAILLGMGIGIALAKTALASFGELTAAWVRLPHAELRLELTQVLLAAGVGFGVSLGATALAMRSMVAEELASSLPRGLTYSSDSPPIVLPVLAGVAVLIVAVILVSLAPRTLPFLALIAYVLTASGAVLVGLGLLAPLLCWLTGRWFRALFARSGVLSLRLAASNVAKKPTEPIAVVVAIVMALGATLADASLIASVKATWFRWMSDYVRCDIVVTGEGGIDDLLTLAPISEHAVQEMREVEGVGTVRAIRIVEGEYDGHPIVIEGIDDAPSTYPLPHARWPEIEAAFVNGDGVLVSENLAWRASLRPNDSIGLRTPSGLRSFRVLAAFPDALAGDLGSVAFDRRAFRRLWDDRMVSRIHVWTEPSTNVEAVRDRLQQQFGASQGVRALTVSEARLAVGRLVDNAFSSAYALLAVAVTISVVGIVNFLLAAVLDRKLWFQTLYTVGVSKRQLGTALVGEGALIGLVGVTIGLLAGAIVSYVIVRKSIPMVNGWHFDYVFPAEHAVVLSLVAFALTTAAGLLPAWLALRRDGYLGERAS